MIFVDSSAPKADHDSKDDFGEAPELMKKIAAGSTDITSFMTTDYVFGEAVTLTRFAHSRRKAVELAEATLSPRFVTVVYSDGKLFLEGMRVFNQHPDKEWSFTDYMSFATMRRYDLRTSFTFDAHFTQAGSATIP